MWPRTKRYESSASLVESTIGVRPNSTRPDLRNGAFDPSRTISRYASERNCAPSSRRHAQRAAHRCARWPSISTPKASARRAVGDGHRRRSPGSWGSLRRARPTERRVCPLCSEIEGSGVWIHLDLMESRYFGCRTPLEGGAAILRENSARYG